MSITTHQTTIRQWVKNHTKDEIAVFVEDQIAKRDARIEFLEKVAGQAVCAGELTIQEITKDEKSYGMHRYVGETLIVGRSSTEVFFGSRLADSPELAAWLKEKENGV